MPKELFEVFSALLNVVSVAQKVVLWVHFKFSNYVIVSMSLANGIYVESLGNVPLLNEFLASFANGFLLP